MVRAFDARVVEFSTPTSTGTQDYTVPGIGGNAIGALFIVTQAVALDTETGNIDFSWGVTDGTTHQCRVWVSRDNSGTSICGSSGSTDVIRLLDVSTLAEAVVGEFDSFISNGIRVNYTTVAPIALKGYVVLFFGTDAECGVFFANPPGTVDTAVTVNVGFEPTAVLTATAKATQDESLKTDMNGVFGIAVNDGSDTNCDVGLQSRALTSISSTYSQHFNDRVDEVVRFTGAGGSLVTGGDTTIENFTSTGFDVFSRGAANAQDIIGLAIRTPSSSDVLLRDTSFTDSSTGDTTRSSLGLRPGLMYRTIADVSSPNTRPTEGSVSIGVCDYTLEQFCLSNWDQNGQGVSNAGNTLVSGYHALDSHSGVDIERGTITDIDDGEYTINMTAVTVAPHYYNEIIFAEIPFDGDISVALPSMSATLDAELQFDGVVDVALPGQSVSVTAELQLDGTIDVSLPAQSAELEAELQLDAAIEVTFPSQAASLEAELDLDSTIDVALPSQSADLEAGLQFDADIDIVLPSQSAELEAELQLDGTIDVLLPSKDASLEAELDLDASIDVTFPSQSPALDAEIQLEGTIDVTLPAQAVDVEAEVLAAANDSEISVALPSQSATIEAELELDADIDAVFPTISTDLDVELLLDGAINVLLPGQNADLTADLIFDAEVGVELPGQSAEIEALAGYVGTIATTLPPMAVDGELEVLGALTATIEAALPSAATSLEVELQYDAAIGVTFPSIAVQILDAPLLGCDTELQASAGPRAALLGSSDVRTALVGSSNVTVVLDASSRIIVNLTGSSDSIAGLGGSSC